MSTLVRTTRSTDPLPREAQYARTHRLGDNATMIALSVRCGCLSLLAGLSSAAPACDSGSFPLFGCDAAKSRKFIELCAPSPLDAQSGYLRYRFGSLDENGAEKALELEYPAVGTDSLKRFYAATYTHGGVYTQSVRFVAGNFGYTVFTRARGSQVLDAGVEVHDRKSGKTSVISCSERPRFYVFDLKGLVPCDPETPVGTACVK
jgi:hypothetical protein